jgi:hypothetical protein
LKVCFNQRCCDGCLNGCCNICCKALCSIFWIYYLKSFKFHNWIIIANKLYKIIIEFITKIWY